MSKGLREGKGIYYHIIGNVYKGEWHQGKKHGFGVEEGLDVY